MLPCAFDSICMHGYQFPCRFFLIGSLESLLMINSVVLETFLVEGIVGPPAISENAATSNYIVFGNRNHGFCVSLVHRYELNSVAGFLIKPTIHILAPFGSPLWCLHLLPNILSPISISPWNFVGAMCVE